MQRDRPYQLDAELKKKEKKIGQTFNFREKRNETAAKNTDERTQRESEEETVHNTDNCIRRN